VNISLKDSRKMIADVTIAKDQEVAVTQTRRFKKNYIDFNRGPMFVEYVMHLPPVASEDCHYTSLSAQSSIWDGRFARLEDLIEHRGVNITFNCSSGSPIIKKHLDCFSE